MIYIQIYLIIGMVLGLTMLYRPHMREMQKGRVASLTAIAILLWPVPLCMTLYQRFNR